MHILKVVLLFLLGLCLKTSAQSTTTYTTAVTFCKTSYGTGSIANPPTTTSRYQDTTTLTYVFVSTPTKVIRPTPVTVFRTIRTETTTTITYSPTTSPVTSISSTTITQTLIVPSTTLTVTTVFVSTESFQPVVTINGAPSFTPILDTLPGSSPRKRALRFEPRKDAELAPRQGSASTYAQHVDCAEISKTAVVVIYSAKGTSTSTLSYGTRTLTQNITTTITSTSSVFSPYSGSTVDIKTTYTYTTTRTPRATYTPTQRFYTTTTVLASAVSTVYPQCQDPRNTAYKVNGLQIQNYESNSPAADNAVRAYGSNEFDSTKCCALCIEDPSCAAIFTRSSFGHYSCVFLSRTNGVCDANNPLLLRVVTANTAGEQFESDNAFNNKCGKFVAARKYSDPA